ncbi:hypothetical protein FHT36_003543 [Xanthobacter sp. SG618]|uniref:hypothetical protein n=1 Tax=Xanthobacter sp. SG618 TaxID=2587121 RepID=UPI00145EAD5F|nr:hypothetical protein [Xanthobacter sp. SG618]NMN59630.1 hypothetical protein [Xanthobacter sp. SG618]
MRAATAVLVLGCLLVPLSLARADDCQSVADAYDRLSKVPAYRQVAALGGAPLMEAVIVGDVMYVKHGAKWTKMPLGPGGRVEMQKQVIPSAASLKDCRRVGPETVQGKNAVAYDYTPPPMPGAVEFDPQRVWIAVDSGLPIRMTSKQQKTEVVISFDNVVAPIP